MAEFLTTIGISSKLEDIINYSKQELILISPYYQLSETFYNRMIEASRRGVNITIVFGKKRLKSNEFYTFAEIPQLELLYCHNLHAKCYFNEVDMVVCSMNMYAYSQRNNREMGVFIQRNNDHDFFNKAKQEAFSIIDSSELVGSNRQYSNSVQTQKSSGDYGFCIRCETKISFDIGRPYCQSCFSVWMDFQNPDYQESVCHSCGVKEPATLRKPFCYGCFTNYMV
ncbi:phospholipase D-like domain-containing protein [Fodinibius sp. N2]|uniref:phospholipase D-like domain-containing protein n=1 Tax=Fodinibius alkaliphilus TaxID=3140241 RepID=UPI00315A66B0